MIWTESKVHYLDRYPSKIQLQKLFGSQTLVIFDERLLKICPGFFKNFNFHYAVKSGEGLKALKKFPRHAEKVLEILKGVPSRDVHIVCVGGGSVGDFAGFLASTLRRGLPFSQIPSTWLAAIDSAHGGKTALNSENFKNQIGSFYPAGEILLIKELLCSQSPERIQDALGEVVKMALLRGGKLWDQVKVKSSWSHQDLWKVLPLLIEGKLSYVRKDPFEKKGIRYFLNLGHTVGHIFESRRKLTHGLAVFYGLKAALQISQSQRVIGLKSKEKLLSQSIWDSVQVPVFKKLSNSEIRDGLQRDKKASARNQVKFILIRKPGSCLIRSVKISDVIRGLHGF